MIYSNDLSENIEKWRSWLLFEKKYSTNTLESYMGDVRSLFSFLRAHFQETVSIDILENVTISDIRAWLAKRRGDGIGNRSNNRALCSLNSFFSFMFKSGFIKKNIIVELSRPKIQKSLPSPVRYQDILAMIELLHEGKNVERQFWLNVRDAALIVLIYCCGLRISEALSLRVSDIADIITVKGKGGKERIIPVLPIVKENINSLSQVCPYITDKSSMIFFTKTGKLLSRNYADTIMRKIKRLLGLPDGTCLHSLRHSFATHMIQNNADIRTVQELLGHSSLSTTQIYTKIDKQQIISAYKSFHPLSLRKDKQEIPTDL